MDAPREFASRLMHHRTVARLGKHGVGAIATALIAAVLPAGTIGGAALRRVFGRVPSAWPFFPGAGSPQWSIEGLAVVAESRFTGMGRVHGAYHRMVARAALLYLD